MHAVCICLDEGDLGVRGVDLPDVEFLVLLEAGVDLVAVEALGESPLHDVGHLDDTGPALRNHVFDDLVHLVRDVLRPAEKTWKIYKVLRQEGVKVKGPPLCEKSFPAHRCPSKEPVGRSINLFFLFFFFSFTRMVRRYMEKL